MKWFSHMKTKGQNGATVIFTAVLLPIVLGVTGLAVDAGNVYLHQSNLQNAVDSAALAGGYKYAEQENASETENTVSNYLKTNEQNSQDQYSLKNLSYSKKDNATKITVTGEQSVPMHFMQVFGVPEKKITAKATAQVAYVGDSTPRIFDYTMIGGYDGKPSGKSNCDRKGGRKYKDVVNSFVFNSTDIDVTGKVHSNGPMYLDDNHFVKMDQLTCVANKDSDLWSNYRDNYYEHYTNGQDSYWDASGQHYYDDADEATRLAHINPGHENDEKISDNSYRGYNWRYYYRSKDTNGQDYTAPASTADKIDISFSKSNPMTSALYEQVEKYKKMTLTEREAAHIYIDTDTDTDYDLNPSHTKNIYPGLTCGKFKSSYDKTSQSWKIWDSVYKVVIVNGDLNVNIPKNQTPDNDTDHLLLVSLNGNINLQGDSPFYGYIYAPNGTVTIDGSCDAASIFGSVVARSIYMTTCNQKIHATHRTYTDSGSKSSGKGGKIAVSLVDDEA